MDLTDQQRTIIEPLFEEKRRRDGRGRVAVRRRGPSPALRSRFALPGVVVRPLEAGLRTGALPARGRR